MLEKRVVVFAQSSGTLSLIVQIIFSPKLKANQTLQRLHTMSKIVFVV